MEKKYLATVYPYTYEFLPFLSMKKFLGSVQINNIVSPIGMGRTGIDASDELKRETCGFVVLSDFECAINESDTLLVPPGIYHEKLMNDILDKASTAAKQGKNIIWAGMYPNEQAKAALESECAMHDSLCIWKGSQFVNHSLQIKLQKLYAFDASIVFVNELVSGMNGIETTISLHNYLSSKGFKVISFIDSNIASLFGFRNTNELYKYADSKSEIIQTINERLHKIEEELRPDVMILHVPGSIARFNEYVTEYFGYFMYVFSQAITPDAYVCCVPYKYLDDNFYAEMNTLCTYRFGFSVKAIHMSNVIVDASQAAYKSKLDHIYVNQSEVVEYIDSLSKTIPVFAGLTKSGCMRLCGHIENILHSYAEGSPIPQI